MLVYFMSVLVWISRQVTKHIENSSNRVGHIFRDRKMNLNIHIEIVIFRFDDFCIIMYFVTIPDLHE